MWLDTYAAPHPSASCCQPTPAGGNPAQGNFRRSQAPQPQHIHNLRQSRRHSSVGCGPALAGEDAVMLTPSMQSRVEEYLDDRRRLGFSLKTTGSYLMAFARFADRSGHTGPLSSEIILTWAQSDTASTTPTTWAKRLINIRRFLNYCAQTDGRTEVPDTDVFGRPRGRPTPHIYAEAEIVELLA